MDVVHALATVQSVVPSDWKAAWAYVAPWIQNVLSGLLLLLVFLLFGRILRNVVARILLRRGVRQDAMVLATRAIYLGILGLGATLFLAAVLGNATVGVAGVLLAAMLTSFGLQDLMRSYVSGFYVLMEKNVRVGDLVESGGYRGIVTDIRMRVTYLRGEHGEMVVVPNSELFTRTLVVSQAPPDWGSAESAQHDAHEGIIVPTHQL